MNIEDYAPIGDILPPTHEQVKSTIDEPASGRMLGNFPQAFSHVGLVNTALNLTSPARPADRRKGA